MSKDRLGPWLTSQYRVVALTALGTVVCIIVALCFDSLSLRDMRWEWGPRPWNNVLVPLVLAPPFFYLLLTKVRALSVARHRIEVAASTDSLTSCLNRAAFATLVDAYLDKFRSDADRNRGALLVIDVDFFKLINDSYGHDIGDEALSLIANAIRKNLRDRDLVGRLGGEEFCVFLPGASEGDSRQIAERIRGTVETTVFAPAGVAHPLSVSIGGAPLNPEASFSSLYRAADQRLYEAKRTGRNRVVVATDLPSTTIQ